MPSFGNPVLCNLDSQWETGCQVCVHLVKSPRICQKPLHPEGLSCDIVHSMHCNFDASFALAISSVEPSGLRRRMCAPLE